VATQKEVAKLAGVSFITVSRVVNNEGNVKEETRLRVEEAIRRLGYFPSHAGKALNTGKNGTLGIMTPARFGDGMENAYLMGVLRGIELKCRERGQDILLSPMNEDDPNFDFLRPYRQRKVDGMIYVGLRQMPEEMRNEIARRLIPCVVVGDRPAYPYFSWIDTDNETAGYETTRRIWEAGHRAIAFHGLNPGIHNANIADRERGYRRAIRELSGNDADESLIWRADFTREAVRESVAAGYTRAKTKPTALFCSTDNRAIAALEALNGLSLRCPDDLSLVGFDGFIRDIVFSPVMATNEQPLTEMGKAAAGILLDRIDAPDLPRREVIFPVTFVDGESLGRI